MKVKAVVGSEGLPDDSDVVIRSSIMDVRCAPTTTACGNANALGTAPDYTGQLRGNFVLRLTDHNNAVGPGGGSNPATTVDLDFQYPYLVPCGNTADISQGATCTANVSMRALLGNQVAMEGKRSSIGIGHITITDGGPDGDPTTSPQDNNRFAEQGVFVP